MNLAVPKNHFWNIVAADAIVLIVLSIVWLVGKSSSGDRSIALGAVFLAGFLFVSVPLFFIVFANAIVRTRRTALASSNWVITYVAVSLVVHLLLAVDAGFFDKWIGDYERYRIETLYPAQTKLRDAMNSGPSPILKK
ncbi:hypothetical protein [Oceanicoccus sp. KOV_DT_Chl]|uniref:hypothetical protein n=1 Tax=Oceanicoccus sp. KOV_DT_Chl TaxID=1904639 RepID=UPI000C7CF2D6|nr:hypothetical protein [Oceanicoccus sp. KOV_DT_Chl]